MGSSSADPVTPSNQDKWDGGGQSAGGPGSDPIGAPGEHPNGSSADDHLGGPGDSGSTEYSQHPTGNGVGRDQDGQSSGEGRGGGYRGEKQIKPNKVYIGGLPEHTRKEDLESCFGKIGAIVNVELKLGYGFVEFESREAAEESVAKYHEGFFMGNKIRVELSHGGGRTAKYSGEPGACFKCGQQGHWARECPNHGGNTRRGGHHSDAPLIDRIQPSRDYPAPRDYPPYRGDDFSRNYPQRDRYYDYPPPPARDYRRPVTPPRDYPPGPPPRRDYDDYRIRGPPPARYDTRSYYPDSDGPPPYPPSRNYGHTRDSYDRRGPPPERYPPYPPPSGGRRSPPPPRGRDDFERPPPRDYPPRSMSPRSYDYPPRQNSDAPPNSRYRRRSQSPPPRAGSNTYDAGYQGGTGGPPYSGGGPPAGYTGGNGYPGNNPPRNAGNARDYPPRASRDNAEPPPGYRRL